MSFPGFAAGPTVGDQSKRLGARLSRSIHLCGIGLMLASITGCADVHLEPQEVEAATELLIAPPRPVNLSPDRSQLLLYTRTRFSGKLQVMELASKAIVTEHEFDRRQPLPVPSWSPDGSRILFVESTGAAYQLKVWNLATGEVVSPKALLSKNIHGQQWNAAGDQILHFVHPVEDTRSWRDGQRALYWVDPAGIEEPEVYVAEIGQSYHKALSPDGTLAAFYPSGTRGTNVLTIQSEDGTIEEFHLDPTSEIGQMAWSGSESLLMSVRRAGQAFYGIEEVDLTDGSVGRIADEDWDLSAAAYLWDRTALRHIVNVDGLRRTRVCRVPEMDGCYWIGPDGAGSSILSLFAEGDSAFVLITGPDEPPSLHVADMRTGHSVPVFWESAPSVRMRKLNSVPSQGKDAEVSVPGGVPLGVSSEDGVRIPAYHWKAESIPGKAAAALIHVPGGPGLQGVPVWEPYISYLTSRGIDVVYMNFRGQTGYGASYEQAPGGITARAQEVLSVRRHLLNEMGINENRVILYGHSYGAPIVMYAAALGRLMSPLLLASATPLNEEFLEVHDRCVVAFHGDSDIIVSPASARETYRRFFGETALDEPCGHFQTLPNEGHIYESAASYAQVFAASLKMVE